jgi:diguanylate cyclase (GGDEF)-like protein
MSTQSTGQLAEQLWEISHASSEQAALSFAVSLAHDAAGAERCVVMTDRELVLELGFAGIGPPLTQLRRLRDSGAGRGPLGDWGEHEVCVATLECEPRMWLVACRPACPFDLRERDRVFTIAHVLSMTLALLRRGRERDELRTVRERETQQLRAAERELAHQALHDRLTGLPNRELILDRAKRLLGRAVDFGDRFMAAIAIDIDGFKLLNDALDHERGDRLLAEVGRRLSGVVGEFETVNRTLTAGRLGSDEFLVLGERLAGEQDVVRIAERVREVLREPMHLDGHELTLTASIGISCTGAERIEQRRMGADAFVSDAEVALARAKELGGDRYEIFDERMRARLFDRALLEADLRGGIERDELTLLYQPVVTVADAQMVAVEALVRWAHPLRGLLGPGEFIPLAEQSDLIVELGTWVIDEACAQIRRWRDAHPARLGLRVSVNVSARQLQPALVDTVTEALARHGVDPGLLALEITETMLVDGTEVTREVLDALAATGVSVVLDDFGTGYSSLSYLRELPLQQLKLDRSFCAGLQDDLRAAKIVAATIEMARALGLTIVAEGVETPEQLTVLRRLGSDFAQGFWFARPEPADAVLARMVQAYEADSLVAAQDGAVQVQTSVGPAVLERRHGERRDCDGRRASDQQGVVPVRRAPSRTELTRLAADALPAPDSSAAARAAQRASLGRLAGWLYLGGSVIALPADYFMHAPSVLSVILLTLMGLVTGAACLALPWERLSERWLHAVAALATLEVTTSVVVVGSKGVMLTGFYPLVATIVAYGFRDRRLVALHTALILAARVIPSMLLVTDLTQVLPGASVGALTIVTIVIVVVILRERLEGTADRLRVLAERDPLTDVGNYRLLHDRLRSELEHHREHESPLSVLLVDLDAFKQVNERLGHAAGDDVLRRVARTLRDAVREHDTVARQGGDEFAVLAPDTDAEGAAMLAGRLRQRLRRLQFAGDAIDATIGWAVYPTDGDTPRALLAQADSRLLGGKRTGERALPAA